MEMMMTVNTIGVCKIMQGVLPINGVSHYILVTVDIPSNRIVDLRSHYIDRDGKLYEATASLKDIQNAVRLTFLI